MDKEQPANLQEILLLALRESGAEMKFVQRNDVEHKISTLLIKIYGEAEFKASVAASAIIDVMILEGALVPLNSKANSPYNSSSQSRQ